MAISSFRRYPASNVSKGSLDASLAANLPVNPRHGDTYDISVAGSFEGDALIIPVGAYFSVPDQVRWNDVNWVKMEAGDNISDAAFDASWDGNVNNAPSKNAVYDEMVKKVNILDSTTAGFGFVIDEDNLVSNLDTKVPTQQSVKAYADAKVNDTAFAVEWDADTAIAPSKNAVYDVINPIKTKSDQQDAVKEVATQTYSIIDTDHGKTLFFTYAGAVTITCPQSLTSTVHVTCVAEGETTTLAFVAGSGATLVTKGALTTVTERYGVVTLIHKGSNAWFGFGNLA